MADLFSIAEAQQLVLERSRPLPAENVPLEVAARRVLAEPARAEIDLPPFPSSAMDGYAIRAGETPGRLGIQARIAAGNPATASLEPGQAMGIATGGVVPDGADEAALRGALEHGLDADVVVTSGGVSVGPHDLVRRVEAELGVEEVFWRVSVKPGKPIAFGVRERTLVFGLPGNPVSALVGFVLFVEPAIRALQGVPDPLPRFDRGRLVAARRRNPERDELVRARLRRSEDGPLLEPLSGQESHMIARSAGADALVFVSRGEGELADGALVDYLRLE